MLEALGRSYAQQEYQVDVTAPAAGVVVFTLSTDSLEIHEYVRRIFVRH